MNTNMENELIECATCGLLFDPSDLANVFAHEHDIPVILEDGKYIGEKFNPSPLGD